jgi:TonB family protein
MKYKFVKKGTEISSDKVSDLMDFGQVVDKAAGFGMGAAPLAKGALGTKTVALSKVLWVLAVPFSVSVYFAITELTSEPAEVIPVEEPVEIMMENPTVVTQQDSIQQEEQPKEKEVSQPQPVTEDATGDVTAFEEELQEPEDMLIKEDIMIKAEPIGGFPAFYELIDRELTYPEAARTISVEGYVQVYFVVDTNGKAGKFRVVRSLGDHFDKEALRVMKMVRDWKPATHNGQPVSSHMSIKLRFKLEKPE